MLSVPLLCLPGNNPEGRPSPPTSTLLPAHRARSQATFLCRLAGHGSPPGGDGGGMATQDSGRRSNRAVSEPPRVNHRSSGQFQVTGEPGDSHRHPIPPSGPPCSPSGWGHLARPGNPDIKASQAFSPCVESSVAPALGPTLQ